MEKSYLFKFISRITLTCILILGVTNFINAQVQSPCDANPFCSDSAYVFPNATAGTLPAGVTLGCLGSAPFPMWYYMQIGVAGTIQLTMVQTGPGNTQLDIDFSMFGPYVDLPTGCAAILAGAAPIQCSYSGSFTETIGLGLPGGVGTGASTPPAAQVGEVYIVLLTNFSQQPGSISFSQTAGTGAADCGIVCGLSAENSGSVCVGNPVTLTGINTDTTQAFSYHWTGPGGFTANNKIATFNPTSAGTFVFDLMAISQDNDTCHASTEVIIKPLPNILLVDASDQILCNIDSVTLEVATPTAGDTYQWYKNNTLIPGAIATSFVADTTGTYKVIGITPLGCTDTSEDVYVKLSFTDVDFDFSIMKGCEADSVQFTNLSEPGLYWWYFGDGTQPDDTTTNPAHTYQDQNNYIVRLKMQDMDGCVDSVLKIVDVRHPLIADFTSDVDSVCQTDGSPVQFTDASTGAVTGWKWDFNDGGISSLQNPQHAFSLAGTRQVRLVVSDAIPCYDTVYHNIYVDSLPFLSIVTDKHAICKGDKVNFTANYLNTALSLNWDFGDGSHWYQSNATSHSYDQEGTHFITVTADYAVCASAIATDSVVVKSLPVVNLGPDSVLCLDGPSIHVSDINNASDPTVSWLWNTGATTSYIDIVHPGIYTVTATRNDCSTTGDIEVNKDCYTDVPNAFTPNGDGYNDYFYPRQLLSKGVSGFTMTVFNRWGQKVFETSNTNGRGWDGKFNDKNQPTGVYIYQIKAVLKNGQIEEYSGNVTLMR
jgi:gliding motility-associated-like protein